MFTGLIQKVGRVTGLTKSGGGMVLTVAHEPWDEPLAEGESIAVNGACLTVSGLNRQDSFTCDVLDETLARTTLGAKQVGAKLNLERALRASDRLGGHMVTGHVDGIGRIVSIKMAGRDHVLTIKCDELLMSGIVEKGSVACDGISLTVSAVNNSSFEVNLIPFTWEHTSLAGIIEGDTVNIETDVIGKYIRHYLGNKPSSADSGLTLEDLQQAGFV